MNGNSLSGLGLLALTAALSPFSLVAFSLVLATDRGPRNGIAFIIGWITTISLVAVGVAALGSQVTFTTSSVPGQWTLAAELAIGVGMIAWWIRRRMSAKAAVATPGAAEVAVPVVEKPEPAWQKHLGTMKYPGAFLAGGLVQTWPVMLAGVAEILRANLGTTDTILTVLIFAVATTTGLIVLEVLAWRNPGSAAERLNRIRTYVDTHRESVVNWLLFVTGAWLVIRSAIALAT